MVREFGLSPALGPVGYPEGGSVFLGGGGGQGLSSRPFAEATQAVIDSEVARLLREAEQSAVALIRGHRAELGRLVSLLLEKETVDGEDVYRIVGRAMPVHRPVDALVMAPHMATAPLAAPVPQPASLPQPAPGPAGAGPGGSRTEDSPAGGSGSAGQSPGAGR
jgi:cell division protease FtsH